MHRSKFKENSLVLFFYFETDYFSNNICIESNSTIFKNNLMYYSFLNLLYRTEMFYFQQIVLTK